MATIAEVLHYAADYSLMRPKCIYSCSAVIHSGDLHGVDLDVVFWGLRNMGLKAGSMSAFDDVKDPKGARYMWLKFAALIAEEQGV